MLIIALCTLGFAYVLATTLRGPLTAIERLNYIRQGRREPWWHKLL